MAKINLKIKRDKKGEIPETGPEYPSLYLSDVTLPLTKDNVGKTMKAVVTLKFTGYREDNSVKKNYKSYDFAIQDIEFSGKGIAANNARDKMDKIFK